MGYVLGFAGEGSQKQVPARCPGLASAVSGAVQYGKQYCRRAGKGPAVREPVPFGAFRRAEGGSVVAPVDLRPSQLDARQPDALQPSVLMVRQPDALQPSQVDARQPEALQPSVLDAGDLGGVRPAR